MWSLNKAQVIGNVTRDPEIRYTPNGQSVASFGVATNRRWKNQNGEFQEDTQFHEIVVWGKLAETLSQIVKKGNKIYIEGRLQTRGWEAPDGSKRSKTEIILENFVPLTPKGEFSKTDTAAGETAPEPAKSATPSASPSQESAKEKTKPKKAATQGETEEINLDDIPF